ncbi:MAG: hypothetical protein RIS64_194 [Bacteroidota bacterium]|jgi:hypothetical protein
MKNFFAIATLVGMSLHTLNAQTEQSDSTRTRYLFAKPSSFGLYVAPEASYGQLNGEMTTFAGSSFMLIFNQKWSIGATGTQSTNRTFSPAGVKPWYMNASYGGLKVEYTVNPNAPIHVTFPLTLGMGVVSADSLGTFKGGRNNEFWGGSNAANRNQYGVVIPGIALEANLFRFAKVSLGANYRLAFAQTLGTKVPENSLNGFNVSAGVKVGLFDISTSKRKRHHMSHDEPK